MTRDRANRGRGTAATSANRRHEMLSRLRAAIAAALLVRLPRLATLTIERLETWQRGLYVALMSLVVVASGAAGLSFDVRWTIGTSLMLALAAVLWRRVPSTQVSGRQ